MIRAIQKIFRPSTMNKALAQFGNVSIQHFLLFSLAGILVVLLMTLVCRLMHKKILLSDVLTGMVFAVYGSIILQLTLVCRESGSRIGIDLDVLHGLTGPDNEFHWLMMAYAVLNCLLFVPYGFILSLFSFVNGRKKRIQVLLVLLMSFATSLFIESAQLMTGRGYYETQDLAMNTLGGVLGWILFAGIFRLGKVLLQKKEESW
ncbi:MAG: VanZ family protein [Acetatifactor sp.]